MLFKTLICSLATAVAVLAQQSHQESAIAGRDSSWTICALDSFALATIGSAITIGNSAPTIINLIGWYTATVNNGATVTLYATVNSLTQQQSWNFCSLTGVTCPVAAAWVAQDMLFILPGVVAQSGTTGSAKIVVTNNDGTTVLCLQNTNVNFQ